MKTELERVRLLANEKLQGGSEPPWSWYQYMKLVEACDAILAGMDATVTMENSPQSETQQGVHLRLVDATYQRDSAQCRLADSPVQMPM